MANPTLHALPVQCSNGYAGGRPRPTRLPLRRPALTNSADIGPLPPSGTTAELLPRPGQDGLPVEAAARSSAEACRGRPADGAATFHSAALEPALYAQQPAALQDVASFPLQSIPLSSSPDANQVRGILSSVCNRQLAVSPTLWNLLPGMQLTVIALCHCAHHC